MDNDVQSDQMATACCDLNGWLLVMERTKRKTSSNLLHVIRTIETLYYKCAKSSSSCMLKSGIHYNTIITVCLAKYQHPPE